MTPHNSVPWRVHSSSRPYLQLPLVLDDDATSEWRCLEHGTFVRRIFTIT
jgi:hypothetical protein